MRPPFAMLLIALLPWCVGAQADNPAPRTRVVITDDIDRFWDAFDQVGMTADSAEQVRLVDRLFVQPGTPGLRAMIERRGLTPADYVDAIRRYPRFWASVRPRMQHAAEHAAEIAAGISSLRALYPDLRPARIFFTVGALMTNGMTLDDVVFIGSELALADSSVVTDEFPERLGHLPGFLASNPSASVAFLNVHEYVHTQQGPFGADLLAMALQEGVAEFIATLATGAASPAPAIAYGRANDAAVREAFRRDMFGSYTGFWLWSNADNAFGTRDLGYYVGYAIAERFHARAADTTEAVAQLIELAYQDPAAVDALVDASGYFAAPLKALREDTPRVVAIEGMANGARDLAPGLRLLTIEFSRPVDPQFRGFDYGPLGADHVLPIRQFIGLSDDGLRLTVEVELAPSHRHQTLISSGFRGLDGVRLIPCLIDVGTGPVR